MNMSWDATLVAALARELDRLLRGWRVRAIRLDGREGDVDLFMYEGTLRWRLHASRGWVGLMGSGKPSEDAFRLSARIRRVWAPADERMITVECLPYRGRTSAVNLVLELIGNRRNFVVVEAATGIVRHELRAGGTSERAGAGHPYVPVSPSLREGTDGDLSVERFGELMEAAGSGGGCPPPRPRAFTRAILGRLAWSSAINARTLLDLHQREGTKAAHRLWRRLAGAGGADAADTEAGGPDGPVILLDRGGGQPYPLALPGTTSEAVPSLLEAFRLARGGRRRAEDQPVGSEPTPQPFLDLPLLARLAACREVLERRLKRIEGELGALEDPAAPRALGDLILARYGSIPQGAAEVLLDDPEGEPVMVPLEPGAPPHVSAERYYRRAAKLERAAARLPDLMERARNRLDALTAVEQRLRRGEAGDEEIRHVMDLAAALGVDAGGRRQRHDPKRGNQAAQLPYRSFRSSGGLEIRVGLGARRNDDLTFHHSAPHDVWLHARHASGAHVILRWAEREANPAARDIEEAGVLAALHSKARTSEIVPVDWTRRRHVRKPRGSPPGSVVPSRVATVFVRPDPALAEALRLDGGA